MTIPCDHHLDWNDRLQDWLDGDVEAGESELIEAHLGECRICQARLAELELLDGALRAAAPRSTPDAGFDQRLYARIGAIDEGQRAQARQRVEQELQQNLHALSRGWRRTLAFLIPGVIAGLALAFALSAWLDGSDVTRALIAPTPASLGHDLVRWTLSALAGTSLGLAVSRWLASVVD